MRQSVLIAVFLLLALSASALANDWGFNQIASYVDLAERRIKENDAKSARFNLTSARDMMPNASAAAKADKGWPALEARIAKLDKQIAALEAGVAKTTGADDKVKEADNEEMQARIAADGDNFDKAVELYKKCSALLEEAASIDATIKTRDPNWTDLTSKCKDGAAAQAKQASGEGKDPATTKEGKLGLAGYEAAAKAMASKKPTAMEIGAGMKGAAACKMNVGYLTSIQMRNGKPMWDGKRYKLGDLTLDEMRQKCDKLEAELKTKPATGCGMHYASVGQTRATVFDRWGRVTASNKAVAYEAIDCAKMPKQSAFPGPSGSYKALYQSVCGKDAIYIVNQGRWIEEATRRYMGADCYKKGTLKFDTYRGE